MAEDNTKQKISQNHDEIYSLLEYLSKSVKPNQLNSLTQEEKEEWRRKHIKLAQQLKEAKDIKEILDKKYHAISNFLEKYKSVETRIQFGNLMEEKIKMMITFKEVEDKIKMEDRKDSFIMQSIVI